MLDRRFKHRLHLKQPFYLFIRNKLNHIFYVRYPDGRQYSTGCTDISEAYAFAQKHIESEKPERNTFHKVLLEYYEEGSKWQEYDLKHGVTDSKMDKRIGRQCAARFSELLQDVKDFSGLTRGRLIHLQQQMLDLKLSAKSVNNYMMFLHRIVKQMVDRESMGSDPFIGLRGVKGEKESRICFPINIIKGKFDDSKYGLMAYVAIATGARRGEFFKWNIEDGYLAIHGTKSSYSERKVPISPETERRIRLLEKVDVNYHDYAGCVQWSKQMLQYDEKGIVFHSFRKMFKTILTSANLNTTLVESFMGHSNNQQSGDVERIYFVEEAADMTLARSLVISAVSKYLDSD